LVSTTVVLRISNSANPKFRHLKSGSYSLIPPEGGGGISPKLSLGPDVRRNATWPVGCLSTRSAHSGRGSVGQVLKPPGIPRALLSVYLPSRGSHTRGKPDVECRREIPQPHIHPHRVILMLTAGGDAEEILIVRVCLHGWSRDCTDTQTSLSGGAFCDYSSSSP